MSAAADETAAPENPELRDSRISWTLLGFIAVSLAAHGFAFLLFQVVYPQRVTIPPPSKQVALLNRGTPEHDAILRWVDAEDPALAASSSAAVPPALFHVPYRPSFATSRTAPRLMPEAPPKPEPHPSPITLPLFPRNAARSDAAPEAPGPLPATSAVFSGGLAERAFTPGAALGFRSAAPLEPATFVVSVNAAGEIRHVFRQRSSGDAAADGAAADYLSGGVFAPRPGAPLTWGVATVTWGAEIYATPASTQTP